jgi:hypothetical protein
MPPREIVWTVIRAGVRRDALLLDMDSDAVICSVMSGAQCVVSQQLPSREAARVLAEQLRQAHLADGWRDLADE